jgi:hypothetical protein
MGYEVHIVRKKDYLDEEELTNITLEEWRAYIDMDEEMELHEDTEMPIGEGKTTTHHSPGFCHWLAHTFKDSDEYIWFSFSRWGISTKYPDDETIIKMISIANILRAKVQGDDGEFYDEEWMETGKPVFLEDEDTPAAPKAAKKPWWKFW